MVVMNLFRVHLSNYQFEAIPVHLPIGLKAYMAKLVDSLF
jgi:hypothetical protein